MIKGTSNRARKPMMKERAQISVSVQSLPDNRVKKSWRSAPNQTWGWHLFPENIKCYALTRRTIDTACKLTSKNEKISSKEVDYFDKIVFIDKHQSKCSLDIYWYLFIEGIIMKKTKKMNMKVKFIRQTTPLFPFPISSSYWISSTTNNKIIYFIINQPLTNKFGHL
jgi:hypothetical protein